MSAGTRQHDLHMNPVYRNPRSAPAAALFRLPPDVRLDEAGRWATTAYHADDGERVLRWLERAKAEGAIFLEGRE
jgi:hypothetical protein